MALVGVRWGGGEELWKRRGIRKGEGEMRTLVQYAVAYQRGEGRAVSQSYNVS